MLKIKNKILRNIGPRRLASIIIFIIAIISIYSYIHFYNKYKELTANPNIEARKEVDELVLKIGKLMELPNDEIPTVATVLDKEQLANQSFFVKSENGDKLLSYSSIAKIAILYRPSTGKIINVAPIENGANNSSKVSQKGHTGHLHRIVYLNGTEVAGKGYLAEKAVQEKYPNTYKTIAVANAVKKDYEGVLVIDLVGDHGEEVRALAKLLGGVVGNLPTGEVTPDADILIISGK